ncbi:MAG: nitrous oxide reductase family maturation protein NosD [Rhodothermales bacterium]|nr:nitrous oxide reductase family maturation protein NosD [Rhodothermales bacterium]
MTPRTDIARIAGRGSTTNEVPRGARAGFRRLVLLALFPLLASLFPATSAAQTVTVTPEGPGLAEVLRTAAPGSRIVVAAGVYRPGAVVVDTPVEIVGEGVAVLDGEGQHQILTVTAPGVTVRGLVFRNVGTSFVEDRAALKVEEGHGCVIEGNRFEDAFFGIYLAKTDGCRVAGNVLEATTATESRSGNGIHLWYSKNIAVEHNTIRGHRDGIYFEFVEDSRVEANVSEENLRYGLHFMFSDRCAYRGNTFRANDAGVAVMYTERVEMTGNRFEANRGSAAYGLLLKDITDSRVEHNAFRGNSVGVYAEGTNRVRFAGNDFLENGWAVKIMANALDNLFTANNFAGNTFDVATNSRRHYSTFEGNYWDRYAGYDLDRDGTGDVPFRPVRLFALVVEQNAPSLVLLRSLFVDLLDAAERVVPALTPETLADAAPQMRRIPRTASPFHPATHSPR